MVARRVALLLRLRFLMLLRLVRLHSKFHFLLVGAVGHHHNHQTHHHRSSVGRARGMHRDSSQMTPKSPWQYNTHTAPEWGAVAGHPLVAGKA